MQCSAGGVASVHLFGECHAEAQLSDRSMRWQDQLRPEH